MGVNVGALADRLGSVIDGGAHNAVPQQNSKVVGARVKDGMAQVAVVAGRQRVVEDDAVCHGGEAAQLVQCAENILIGRGPGRTAAACVAGLGDPHLGTGAVGIALFGVQTCQISGHSQVILAEGTVRLPVVGRHHGLQALRNAVVVVVAEHIQLFLHGLHQAVQRNGGQEVKRRLVGLVGRIGDGHTVGGTGADQQAIGIILAQPAGKNIVVLGEQLGGVALGAAGNFQHVRLVDKLGRVDGHTVLFAQGKNLLGLAGVPGRIGMVQTVTVGHADQQLGTDLFAEIQHTQPLFAGQDGVVAFGGSAAGVAVKVVVGFGGPRTGDTHPGGADLLGEFTQLFVVEVDGVIILHQGVFVHHPAAGALFQFKFFLAGNLGGGVGSPECAARDLCHLDIVRDQPCIYHAQLLQRFGIQFHELCHNAFSFFCGAVTPLLSCFHCSIRRSAPVRIFLRTMRVILRFVGKAARCRGGTVLKEIPQYLLLCFFRKKTIIVTHFSFFGRVL